MGQIKKVDELGFLSRVETNTDCTASLWDEYGQADESLIDAEKIIAGCNIPGIYPPGYVTRADQIGIMWDNNGILFEYPYNMTNEVEEIDKRFAEKIKYALNELSTIHIDDIRMENSFGVEITQYYPDMNGDVTTDTSEKKTISLGDFLGDLEQLSTTENSYVAGFTDVIYAEAITDGKTLQQVVKENAVQINEILHGAEFDVKLNHPIRDILTEVADVASIGTYAIYKSYAGYDPITNENLTDEERTAEGIKGVAIMVTFGYGCVTATATGEVAVIYLADVGSEIAGSTTYHVVKAEGGSEESAVILALITASAAGIAIDYEGLKMLSKAGEKTIANGTDEILEQAADTRKIERTVENEIGDAKTVVQKTSYGKSSGNLTEGSLNSVDDIIKGVENGEIKLSNNIQKGNYGEMKMDAYFESQGYERITLDRVTDLNAPTHHGIDGVYYNPDGHPPYIIGEAKYGSSKLSTLADGTRQMSTEWIEGGKGASRLDISVGKNVADDILLEGYDSVLVNVDKNGNITTQMLDGSGQIIK